MKFSPPAYFSGVIDKLNSFVETLSRNEKNMLFSFLFALILVVDYYSLAGPVIHIFTVTVPELHETKQKLHDIEEDLRNKEAIHKQWLAAKDRLAETEKKFIFRTEVPSLLESLSKLAQNCQVKIITLKPLDISDTGHGFLLIPIRMSAMAGTHDLGSFLAQLETGSPFFKVTDVRINSNSSDEHRHMAEFSIETYAKTK